MPHLLLSKLWNSSLCRSIFISVSRAGCPRLERLRLFIHPQTPFNFSSLVLRCPPFPSPLCQISPFLSVLMDYGLRLTVGHYSGSKHNFRPFILAWICSLLPPSPALFQRKLAWFFPACTFRHLTLFSRLLTAPVNLPSVSNTSSRVWALIKLLFVARLPPPESTFISCFGLNKRHEVITYQICFCATFHPELQYSCLCHLHTFSKTTVAVRLESATLPLLTFNFIILCICQSDPPSYPFLSSFSFLPCTHTLLLTLSRLTFT